MFFRMVIRSGQIFLPFCHNTRVWQTDGQTDGRTDRQTDRILIAIPHLHCMQRGKKWLVFHSIILSYCNLCICAGGGHYLQRAISEHFRDKELIIKPFAFFTLLFTFTVLPNQLC